MRRQIWIVRPMLLLCGGLLGMGLPGCRTVSSPPAVVPRHGDEIVVAGQLVRTGTRVITWMDPGGYDGYRVERRFSPLTESDWEKSRAAEARLTTPNRYGLRRGSLSAEELERVRGGGWDLSTLQRVVDQFVLHYDAAGVSKACFRVLHDQLGLSVHFLLDIDGTVYQTLDLKERAWHATIANDRSIGIEIANIGAYPADRAQPLDAWYSSDDYGQPYITVPERVGDPMLATKGFIGRPARPERVRGAVQHAGWEQYDFTPEQYAALIKLTAALCTIFPRITCDYPRGPNGEIVTAKLPDDIWADYQGVLGHYHVQANKIDPGPAFQWDLVIEGARRLLREKTDPGPVRRGRPSRR